MTPFPSLLRRWRAARGATQAQLATDAEISTRHLSFLEGGKAQPSRQMVLVLASALDLPLRDRNALLLSAGFAPMYAETPLDAVAMSPVRRAMALVLEQQEPFGALVMDRRWDIVAMNRGAARLFGALLPTPPSDARLATNLVHLLFHPDGVRRAMVNWEEVAWSFLARLHRDQEHAPGDRAAAELLAEVSRYPGVPGRSSVRSLAPAPFVTAHIRVGELELRLFTVLTAFGTPLDVTAQELVVETFFPADRESEARLRAMAAADERPRERSAPP